MNQTDLRQQIEKKRTEELPFIQWCSEVGGEPQIERVDYFLKRLITTVTVDDFHLLDMEQMWTELLQLNEKCHCGTFSRHWRKKVEVIDWATKKNDGSDTVRSCCFRPDGLLAVYEEVAAQTR
ncbi:MAG: hypothetical protein BA874_12625 [Desulfuromonadales bacterium C00003068]|nr:hypothetical protein [Deltaproteobacteria bacterium]OEU75101.1 MAG: hypothetical protein BA874_12625 [Desulfuromonadales bacterium C00003068]